MKILKYTMAVIFSGLALWFLISTFRDVQDGISGPIKISTAADAAKASQPTAKHLARWRNQAQGVMLATATNDIIGFRRLIHFEIHDSANAVTNWNGKLAAEFINRAGGVERTNLFYNFHVAAGELEVEPDWYKIAQTATLLRLQSGAKSAY